MSEHNFPYHGTVAPMVWALVSLAVLEMLVVHLFLAARWPWLAWPLFTLSVLSILWLVRWIRSFARLPHRLINGYLELRMGSLRDISVALDNVDAVLTSWEPDGHRAANTRNLVPIAHPNRMVKLHSPLSGRRRPAERLAFRVDDPATFDAAMTAAGVRVKGFG